MKIPKKISSPVMPPKTGSLSTRSTARAGGESLSNWHVPQGQILHKPGNEVQLGGTIYRCESVHEWGAKFRNIKNRSDVHNLSNCHDKGQKLNFSGDIVLPAESETKNQTQSMKKTKSVEKPGKIAFVDALLQAGKHTKAEVAAQLTKEYSVPEKTAKNTVSWAASTMKERTGKVSHHKEPVKASAKVPAAKKSAPKAKVKKSNVPKKATAVPAAV